uniref:DUF262 domain-containing protein n=1 Tax=Dialister sp. TaxID=1955814 RepID=UPI0040268447
MEIEKGRIINNFFGEGKKRYSIPVYQRNYEWSTEQCRQLFCDIVEATQWDREHFIGSIVLAFLGKKNQIDLFIIIDGQQRLTTLYVFIAALLNQATTDKDRKTLSEWLFNIDKYKSFEGDDQRKLKLKAIKSDNEQLQHLMRNEFELMDKAGGIYRNYKSFESWIHDYVEKSASGIAELSEGLDNLVCGMITLGEGDDNAQEIFERINSTGVPLRLSDKIRNFVLMTDANQEALYNDYWLKMEGLFPAGDREEMDQFLLDYLNFKMDDFARESTAYTGFKKLYCDRRYDNGTMLNDLLHYAYQYHLFRGFETILPQGTPDYIREAEDKRNGLTQVLSDLKALKQTTVYLFLFHVMDDFKQGVISLETVKKVCELLLNYSVRRLICEIGSNSLRGLYKTLYERVFIKAENKEKYADAVASFLNQLTSKNAMPTDAEFMRALKENNLYRKNALCKYLLIRVENQGKETISVDASQLTIEHIMPQNKDLSPVWRQMLGEDWRNVHEKYLHTLGNLTLTGYNSELGDSSFLQKLDKLSKAKTHVVRLNQGLQGLSKWNKNSITKRADFLAGEILKIFPLIRPEDFMNFVDSRYSIYTAENPENATYKFVNYYELLGERVRVDSFSDMVRSVAEHLYHINEEIIKHMARTNEKFGGWRFPAVTYDHALLKKGKRLYADSDIYVCCTGFDAKTCLFFIQQMLKRYNLDLATDFSYSARNWASVEASKAEETSST